MNQKGIMCLFSIPCPNISRGKMGEAVDEASKDHLLRKGPQWLLTNPE